jgi:hypothetical protein
MKKAEIKDRVSKVDDRTKVLIKKYPLVFTAVLLSGIIIGFVAGLFV